MRVGMSGGIMDIASMMLIMVCAAGSLPSVSSGVERGLEAAGVICSNQVSRAIPESFNGRTVGLGPTNEVSTTSSGTSINKRMRG